MQKALLAVVAFVVLVGCKKDVDKEHMDAVADWSKKICKCKDADDPKKCNEKLFKARPDYGPGIPSDVYTRESMKAWDEISYVGMKCSGEIATGK